MITRFNCHFALLLSCAALLPLLPCSAEGWPEFRGPYGNGHASAPGDKTPIGLPLKWSETENVKWKIEVPHRGWSTPVALDNQIWLTTATPDGKDYFAICVDAETGKTLHNEKLFHCEKPEPLSNNVNCYASPSPAIEKGRVYINFGSYGTACLDTTNFKTIWKRDDLPCRHYRGPGSSVILFEDFLIVTMDGVDQQYVAALDKRTGKTVWKTKRTTEFNDLDKDGKPKREGDFRKAFSTPIIVEQDGKKLMISAASKAVYGYDPKTGQERWKYAQPDYSTSTRPVYGNGLAYVTTGMGPAKLYALRTDGQGDLSKKHVAWTFPKKTARIPSPILVDDLVFMVTDNGQLYCIEAATGKEVWHARSGGNHCASPIYADGRLYLCSVQGKCVVVKAGRTYEVLATNRLEGGFMASPAVCGKALILRTKTHLYRIEEGAK